MPWVIKWTMAGIIVITVRRALFSDFPPPSTTFGPLFSFGVSASEYGEATVSSALSVVISAVSTLSFSRTVSLMGSSIADDEQYLVLNDPKHLDNLVCSVISAFLGGLKITVFGTSLFRMQKSPF